MGQVRSALRQTGRCFRRPSANGGSMAGTGLPSGRPNEREKGMSGAGDGNRTHAISLGS